MTVVDEHAAGYRHGGEWHDWKMTAVYRLVPVAGSIPAAPNGGEWIRLLVKPLAETSKTGLRCPHLHYELAYMLAKRIWQMWWRHRPPSFVESRQVHWSKSKEVEGIQELAEPTMGTSV